MVPRLVLMGSSPENWGPEARVGAIHRPSRRPRLAFCYAGPAWQGRGGAMKTDLLSGGLSGDAMVLLRLLAAALAGVVLGWPRNISEKPIGMRTLGLVSLGAAMVAIAALR